MSKRRKYSIEFKQGAFEQARQPGVSCAQVARLKREMNRVKKERDFLRDAATFFAKG